MQLFPLQEAFNYFSEKYLNCLCLNDNGTILTNAALVET